MNAAPEYAELAVTTNFSFLQGASHPDELVLTAAALGIKSIAIADRNTLAGVVRAHKAAKNLDIQVIIGCRLVMMDGFEVICLPTDKAAYSRLTRLLSQGNLRAEKGNCHLTFDDLQVHAKGQVLLIIPPQNLSGEFELQLEDFKSRFKKGYLALTRYYGPHDHKYLEDLAHLARSYGLQTVATNNILYHIPDRRPLQDILTCIRTHTTVQKAGLTLLANAERNFKTPSEMYRLFPGFPDAVARSANIAEQCRFS